MIFQLKETVFGRNNFSIQEYDIESFNNNLVNLIQSHNNVKIWPTSTLNAVTKSKKKLHDITLIEKLPYGSNLIRVHCEEGSIVTMPMLIKFKEYAKD